MPDTEWTSPRKMMDYYMDQSDGIEACQKRLYLAVMKDEVRVRLKGLVLGPEWLKQIAAMTYDDNPFHYRLTLSCRSRTPSGYGPFEPPAATCSRGYRCSYFVHNFVIKGIICISCLTYG